MTTNSFESQEINIQLQPLPTYIDSDGSFKINTPMLSSYNFDGLIPKKDEPIDVTDVKPGYLIQIEDGGQYFPVVSISADEPLFDDTNTITINYINDLGNLDSQDYDETDTVNAIYEDWDEKIIGSQGWGITSGGNAIFTNVAVRGDLEASTLDVGGVNGITYDGSTVIIGADVVVNAPIEFNGVTQEQLDSELAGYVTGGQLTDNTTTISGGNIKTGTIQSAGFATPTAPYKYDGSEFATNGMAIVLGGTNAGAVIAKNFKIKPNGDAEFKGTIQSTAIRSSDFSSGLDDTGRSIEIFKKGFGFPGSPAPLATLALFKSPYGATVANTVLSKDDNGDFYIGGETTFDDHLVKISKSLNVGNGTGSAYARFYGNLEGSATKLNNQKIASGSINVTFNGSTNYVTTNITFPSGTNFSTTPIVLVTSFTPNSPIGGFYGFLLGATPTGATIGAAWRDSGSAPATVVGLRWMAIQNAT